MLRSAETVVEPNNNNNAWEKSFKPSQRQRDYFLHAKLQQSYIIAQLLACSIDDQPAAGPTRPVS
jgi:hypothetical protein